MDRVRTCPAGQQQACYVPDHMHPGADCTNTSQMVQGVFLGNATTELDHSALLLSNISGKCFTLVPLLASLSSFWDIKNGSCLIQAQEEAADH